MSSNCSIALPMNFKYNKIKKMKKVIIMNRHDDKARELFKQGYNCSQAVVLSFADELPIDFDSLVKISASFGGGIGRMREICGAFSGVCMVIGMLLSNADTNKPDKKKEHYEIVQAFAEEFKKRNGSYRCYELLGIDLKKEDPTPEPRTPKYYAKRPCPEIIVEAVKMIDDYIENNGSFPEFEE